MSYADDLAKVKQNGLNLKKVKIQTPEICLAAVQQNGWALMYVKEQTEAICLASVSDYGLALKFVKKQTEEICMIAVEQYGSALEYVKKPTPEICLMAISKNPQVLIYVKDLLSIALLIDQSILDKILLNPIHYSQKTIENAQTIIKIREAHQIAERINEVVLPSVSPTNKKARL